MAANQQDLNAPFDPTAYTQISGAQLLQLITGAYPTGGFVVPTTDNLGVPDVPNAILTAKWKNYLWLRFTTSAITNAVTGVALYFWNPAIVTDPTYLNWQSVTIGNIPANTIGNAQLQAGAVTDSKVSDVSFAKITGAPGSYPPVGNAGGILSGAYPSPAINAAAGPVIPPALLTVPAASPGAILRLDGTNTPVFTQVGAVQRAVVTIAGQKASAVAMTAANPAIGEGTQIASVNFTPVATNSVIRISLKGRMASDLLNGGIGVFALFAGNTMLNFANVAAATNGAAGVSTDTVTEIEAYITAATFGAAAKIVQARFGKAGLSANTYLGLANGQSIFTVEELFCVSFTAI